MLRSGSGHPERGLSIRKLSATLAAWGPSRFPGGAHLGEHPFDLRELLDGAFQLALHFDGLRQAGARMQGMEGDVAFAEAGDELRCPCA